MREVEEEEEEEEEASTAVDSVTARPTDRRGTLIKKRFDVLRPYVGCAE